VSYAEDEGLDGYDSDDLYYESDTKKYEWEDASNDVHLIRDLETSHIKHIIRGLEDGKDYFCQGYKLAYLKKTLALREEDTPTQPKPSKER
jgi:hypothetical protein